jgi:hypothetical protein
MRPLSLALAALVLSVPALAQGTGPARPDPARPGAPTPPSADPAPGRSPGAPLDRGPHTPEANAAHRGGGAVLEGAPGAPASAPQPTPPLPPR